MRGRQAIRDAAIAELIARGIDGFTIEGVAERAGVDPRAITQIGTTAACCSWMLN